MVVAVKKISEPIRLKKRIEVSKGIVEHRNKKGIFGKGKTYNDVQKAREFADNNKSEGPFEDEEEKLKNLALKIKELAENDKKNKRVETEPILKRTMWHCGIIPTGLLSLNVINGTDTMNDERRLVDNPSLIPSQDSFSAGKILADSKRRLDMKNYRGDDLICIMEPVEAYIVAAGVLKTFGEEANLAYSIDDEYPDQLVLAITKNDPAFPLKTMNLQEISPGDPYLHPPCTGFRILSEKGIEAIGLSLKVERKSRMLHLHITNRILENLKSENPSEWKDPLDEKATKLIEGLAKLTIEADKGWHLSNHTSEIFSKLYENLTITKMSFLSRIQPTNQPRVLDQQFQIASNESIKILEKTVEKIENRGKNEEYVQIEKLVEHIIGTIERAIENIFESRPWMGN